MMSARQELAPTAQQLTIPLDTVKLRGLSAAERDEVVVLLARLLMQAAGVPAREERNDCA
jgi:hypothetical protein